MIYMGSATGAAELEKNMITIVSASKYSANQGEMAFAKTYSDGTEVRAVESKGNIIRCEAKQNGEWVMIGKPYVVSRSKKRNAERIKASVLEFLA